MVPHKKFYVKTRKNKTIYLLRNCLIYISLGITFVKTRIILPITQKKVLKN